MLRKQKDPKMVEAGRKAAETKRQNLERLRAASESPNGKTNGKAKDKTNDKTDDKIDDKPTKTTNVRAEHEQSQVETKWHVTSQSNLTLKVDLPARERLADFCDTPWVEKYRPVCLNECIGAVVGYLKAFVKTGSFPLAIILHGEYGEGKTSIAKAVVRDYFVLRGLFHRDATFFDITHACKVTREYNGIFAPALFIDTTVIKAGGFSAEDVVRTRVQNFMQYSVGKWPKFVVIDEADRLGHGCQEVLTSLIEKYPRTRTVWTLNDIDNIMDRIVSRAAGGVFEIKKPEPKLIIPRLRHIAQWEKARIPETKIHEIAKTAPSVRDAIGLLQQQCILVKATRGRRR